MDEKRQYVYFKFMTTREIILFNMVIFCRIENETDKITDITYKPEVLN
jgi:hypothetical protein